MSSPISTPIPRYTIRIRRLEDIYDSLFTSSDSGELFQYICCIIVTSGTCRHEIDYVSYPLQTGDIAVMLPEHAQRFVDNKEVRGYFIAYYKFALADVANISLQGNLRFYRKASENSLYHSDERTMKMIIDMCESLLVFKANPTLKSHPLIGINQLQALLHTVALQPEKILPEDFHPIESPFGKFKRLFRSIMRQIKTTNDYADMMGISPKTLNKITKAAIGLTAKDFINELMVIQIKRSLTLNEGSVEDIAGYLGFHTTSYMIKFFKNHTGMTPLQFRKMRNG